MSGSIHDREAFGMSVRVRHTAGPQGSEAMLIFLEPPPGAGRPIKLLQSFAKVGPLGGSGGGSRASVVVEIRLLVSDFALVEAVEQGVDGGNGPPDPTAAASSRLCPGVWTVRVGSLRQTVAVRMV